MSDWEEENAEAEVARLRDELLDRNGHVLRLTRERDEARDALKLLRDAVNDSGPCTDDNHGDTCACNADVMIANLGANLRALAKAGDRLAEMLSRDEFGKQKRGWDEAKRKAGL